MPPRTVPLSDLFQTVAPLTPVPAVNVSGIAIDSRLVKPGDLFVALVGEIDRHDFIDDVIARGGVAVVGTRPTIDQDIPYVQVADDRTALVQISAAFYNYPARNLTMLGVTGTDGKTTTSNLLYEILRAAGLQAGMISTVNAVIGGDVLDTGFHVTTPEAMDVQRYLRQMVDAGLTHAVLEATSHGLAQQRVIAADFDIGVVTNITHEHLDWHGSYEAYRADKARLFTGLAAAHEKAQPISRLAVLNRDDISYEYLVDVTKVTQLSYGLTPEADLYADAITHTPTGLVFTAHGPGFDIPITCNLFGDYNVSNCLAAIGAAVVGLGLAPEAARAGIAALPGVPGRMERIDLGQDFTAIVDFAHTPNALKRTLEAARDFTAGRVIAVFGSAGLRDRAKRRMMAETAAELADLTVLTAEDPRTESLDAILAEMAAGAESKGGVEGKTFWRVRDRGEAIKFGLELAQPGDVVLALGKGHEQSMCFGETEYPWDDRTALRAALAVYLDIEGPQMPYLPTQDE